MDVDRRLADAYVDAMQFDRPLGLDRGLVWTPPAAEMERRSEVRKWSQWGPFLTLDEYAGDWWNEISTLRSAAVLGDWSPIGKYEIFGPDASKFMNFACARDLSDQEVGQVMYAPFVNESGKMVHDFPVFRLEENRYRITPDKLDVWLNHIRSTKDFDVEIVDVRPYYCLLAIQGPRSLAVLEALTQGSWRDLGFSRIKRTKIDNFEVEVTRQGFTGEIGYELVTHPEHANELYRAVIVAGEPFGLRPLSNYASRLARVEAGLTQTFYDYKSAGPDATRAGQAELDADRDHVSPFDLGLDRFVDFGKSEFVGKDALEAERASGPKRTFRGLILDPKDVVDLYASHFSDAPGPPPLRMPQVVKPVSLPIVSDAQRIGWATSLTFGPTVRRMIALARIDKAFAKPGSRVAVEWGESDGPKARLGAEVAELPFVPWKRAAGLEASA
jgi:glycine cleavage system aminomethyltransferase T